MSVIKKLGTLIITLFFISIFTFAAFFVIPGDYISASLGTSATVEQIEQAREEAGLNKSLPERYIKWLRDAIKGDFGTSSQYRLPVSELIQDRLFVTVILTIIAMVLLLIFSFPIGIFAAKHEGKWQDMVVGIFTQTAMAIPPFFLGMILILLFGFLLKWFAVGGYIAPAEDIKGFINFMLYPALAIAIPRSAMVIKFLRTSICRQLPMDYVRTAKSKGVRESNILYGHVLQNALIPVIAFIGSTASEVLAGSIIVEQVFNLPGIGRLLVTAISNRDFAVVQAAVLYIAAMVVIINFLADLIYPFIDKRVKI